MVARAAKHRTRVVHEAHEKDTRKSYPSARSSRSSHGICSSRRPRTTPRLRRFGIRLSENGAATGTGVSKDFLPFHHCTGCRSYSWLSRQATHSVNSTSDPQTGSAGVAVCYSHIGSEAAELPCPAGVTKQI